MKYPQLVSMPSAVSDWLEEQLEARGIDAVVYTRYVLSLLHSHTVDVINSDEDLHFSHLKKNCEIESLVDELCEKLKQIKSEDPIVETETSKVKIDSHQSSKVTAQELAAKYYAAFPPLSRNSASPTKLISLIPKWIQHHQQSPKKKPNRKNNKLQSDNNMKAKHSGKRFGGYFAKNKKEFNLSRNVAKSVEKAVEKNEDWELCSFNNNNNMNKLHYDDLNDEEMNMYDDLPVDIRELLDSPDPTEDNVAYMNLANMRDDGKRGFIPCGTNIISSIWSNDSKDKNGDLLDFKFSSISINNPQWENNFAEQNETNTFYEEHNANILAESLMKLNHDESCSGFSQVVPKSSTRLFNPFGNRTASLFSFSRIKQEAEKEDLLTSERTHFRPINEKQDNRRDGQYVDGSTFFISSDLDKVNYKRSESGSLYVETESGVCKKYQEYYLSHKTTKPAEDEFVLKFHVCQNNIACQTDDSLDNIEDEIIKIDEKCLCPSFFSNTNTTTAMDNDNDNTKQPERPESMLDEVMWKYETNKSCEKCKNNNNIDWLPNDDLDRKWDSQSLRNIWSGVEVCSTCANLNGVCRPPPTSQQNLLRQDISEDGEQLLSDLSSLQKLYMEELPVAEISCDISELIASAGGATPKERKRRHSFIAAAHVDANDLQNRSSWSFASRLESDCLIQMTTLPSLRSVTL